MPRAPPSVAPFISVALGSVTLVDHPVALSVDLATWLGPDLGSHPSVGAPFAVSLQPRPPADQPPASCDVWWSTLAAPLPPAPPAAAAAVPAPVPALAADGASAEPQHRKRPSALTILAPARVPDATWSRLLPPTHRITTPASAKTWTRAQLTKEYPPREAGLFTNFGAPIHHSEIALKAILRTMLGHAACEAALAATIDNVAFAINTEQSRITALKHIIHYYTLGTSPQAVECGFYMA